MSCNERLQDIIYGEHYNVPCLPKSKHSMGLGAGRLGDGRCWVQIGRRSLVAGVDISCGQEKWEQGPTTEHC